MRPQARLWARASGTPSSARKSAPPSPKGLTYKAAGVDIDAGDEVVDPIKPIVRRTYSPRVLGLHAAFAGMRPGMPMPI